MGQMAVWMDGEEARVFRVDPETFDEVTVTAPHQHVHRHPKDLETRTHNHPDDEHRFFREVMAALRGTEPILVVGPSVTKLRFLRWVREHDHALEARIVGLESADHPTDRQMVAHVRRAFLPAG